MLTIERRLPALLAQTPMKAEPTAETAKSSNWPNLQWDSVRRNDPIRKKGTNEIAI